MNGAHDLGGMQGFGPVIPEANEPVFHHAWERRVFALTLAMGTWRRWNLDMSRYAREQMPPAEYLATSYYEHWLFGLEKLLIAHGFLTKEEVNRLRTEPGSRVAGGHGAAARDTSGPASAGRTSPLRVEDVQALLRNRRAARMPDDVPARFAPGDRIVARNIHPLGHTRLPRYARGRRGVIDRDHGVFVFADAHARRLGRQPQHVYSVRFPARELWGADAPAHDGVYIDLWDDHLDPADPS